MEEKMKALIVEAMPDAEVEVYSGSGGHYAVRVVSSAFAGKNRVAQQRLVLGALRPVMEGSHAPVHAIDRLITESK